MPFRVAEGIRAAGREFFLIAVEDLTDPRLVEQAAETLWVRHPKLRRITHACKRHGCEELTMVGRIPHARLFGLSPLEMDWTALWLFVRLKDFRADTILKGIADWLARKGVAVISSIRYLGPYMAKKGVLTKTRPSPTALRDIEFGAKLARGLGGLDIGQTVVVKNQSVVALEAMEGTDQCLQRAGDIAGPGCVVVKLPKPNQDMRFDVPVIGINTIEKLAKIKAAALAVEQDRTILIDKETLETADRLSVPIIGLDSGAEPLR